ncbi:sugar ABC transporter ATP-binding protein [Ravibacter arvi]|uniref:Sugar ABC transporter ATP-binding protein n=1 Tax=Ravibacter arvi TaxID=2051041 RepID=A0ABP8LLG5_9BACT
MGEIDSGDSLLEVRGLSKSFSGIKALDGVSFELKKGEVHALMGENGAGKSTFMKILAGLQPPDAGEIWLEGIPFTPKNARSALKNGISLIQQELLFVPELTVAENLFLGKEVTGLGGKWINADETNRQATLWLKKVGLAVSPKARMKTLSIAELQLVEIAKAISNNASVLMMDEPTSALSENEVARLFEIIRELKSKGVGIIYISHKMDEILQIADTVTVFRDGRYIDSRPAGTLDRDTLISLMVGRKLSDLFPSGSTEKGAAIYEVSGLTRRGSFENVSFDLHAGEILGIAGLVGAGRTELARVLFGLDQADRGTVKLHGAPLLPDSPATAIRKGIGYVSEDRKLLGLVTGMSVLQNITLSSLKKHASYGWIRSGSEQNAAESFVRRLRIKCSSLSQKTETLSGGNQQKVAIAKVLLAKPKIIILDEPTRGIDIGAKAEIYQLIRQLASEGLGILLISSELPEITGLCDRVLVLSEGKQTALLTNGEASQEKIMYYAVPGVRDEG